MKMLITEDEKKIRLTEKETNILSSSTGRRMAVVARDVLLHEVWGYTRLRHHSHAGETHIYRPAPERSSRTPRTRGSLVTESGGYRLVA